MRPIRVFVPLIFLGFALIAVPSGFAQSVSQQGSQPAEQAKSDQRGTNVDPAQLQELAKQINDLKAKVEQLEKLVSQKETTASAQSQEVKGRVAKFEENDTRTKNQIQSLWDRTNDLQAAARSEVP